MAVSVSGNCSLPDSVRGFTIHTGNIIHWKELKRKTSQSATDELVDSLGEALTGWTGHVDLQQLRGLSSIDCINTKFADPITRDERKELKVIVKIFLCQLDPDGLREAVLKVLEELDIEFLEAVVVAISAPTSGALQLYHVQPLWMVLESLVQSGQIVTIGVSDLDTELLIDLYNWATVKPSTNQVNLASCCVMPPEMTTFAQEHDIQLLTHNDPKDILPLEVCSSMLRNRGFSDAETWAPLWIARYSVQVKCRGLIQNKGFLACLKKSVLANI